MDESICSTPNKKHDNAKENSIKLRTDNSDQELLSPTDKMHRDEENEYQHGNLLVNVSCPNYTNPNKLPALPGLKKVSKANGLPKVQSQIIKGKYYTNEPNEDDNIFNRGIGARRDLRSLGSSQINVKNTRPEFVFLIVKNRPSLLEEDDIEILSGNLKRQYHILNLEYQSLTHKIAMTMRVKNR